MNPSSPSDIFSSPGTSNEAIRQPPPSPHPVNIQSNPNVAQGPSRNMTPALSESDKVLSLQGLTRRADSVQYSISQIESQIAKMSQQLDASRGTPQEAPLMLSLEKLNIDLAKSRNYVQWSTRQAGMLAAELKEKGVKALKDIISPLGKTRFGRAYKEFCQERGLKLQVDERLQVLTIDSQTIDLHALHGQVLLEGGLKTIDDKDLWNFIGARLGLAQFYTENGPAKSEPGAQQLAHIYKEYLFQFDNFYVSQIMKQRMKMQQADASLQAEMAPFNWSPEQMVVVISLSYMSARDLHAHNTPEKMIQFVENHRASLQRMLVPGLNYGINPLDKKRFDLAYKGYYQRKGLNLDTRLLIIDEQTVDLHALHVQVFSEGGSKNIDDKGMWNIIGARLGLAQFHRTENEPAKYEPRALQLAFMYMVYLRQFDNLYVSRTFEQRAKAKLANASFQATIAAFDWTPKQKKAVTALSHSMSAQDLHAQNIPENVENPSQGGSQTSE
ncbi:hypothetical protein BYT27DRAFT_7337261 [Phlegmacium glaucopus]|nr:hypothetical protein BYT27DRAFT_7337261 [Phlegmacium glaucopus]